MLLMKIRIVPHLLDLFPILLRHFSSRPRQIILILIEVFRINENMLFQNPWHMCHVFEP